MYKAKGFILGAIFLGMVLTSGNIGLACGTPPAPVPQLPANFTTYTDETGVFSISYPAAWEVVPATASTERVVKRYIDNLKSGIPAEGVCMIFHAGQPTETGYQPYVYVVLEPIDDVARLSKVVAGEVQGLELVFQNYQEISIVDTRVGGRAATVIDWTGTGPVRGDQHSLEMITLVDKTTVIVNCVAPPADFAKWQNDFDAIINSFRVNTAK